MFRTDLLSIIRSLNTLYAAIGTCHASAFHNYKYDSLIFRVTYVVIYSYNKSQRDSLFLKFILIKYSTCFGQIYYPSSGVSTLYTQQ